MPSCPIIYGQKRPPIRYVYDKASKRMAQVLVSPTYNIRFTSNSTSVSFSFSSITPLTITPTVRNGTIVSFTSIASFPYRQYTLTINNLSPNCTIELPEKEKIVDMVTTNSLINPFQGNLIVSDLVNLSALDFTSNNLESLILSGVPNLTYLYCNGNKLRSLDVSGLVSLTTLECNNNLIDVTNANIILNNLPTRSAVSRGTCFIATQQTILTLIDISSKYWDVYR